MWAHVIDHLQHPFPGFSGLLLSIIVFVVVLSRVHYRTEKCDSFAFDAQGEKGAFEKLLAVYLRVAEVVIGLAAGSIVLLVGSSPLHEGGRLPWFFVSPLALLAGSIIYGVCFMVFLITDYEAYRHAPSRDSYKRFKYVRNQALGFAGLLCFCVGYVFLIASVAR